MKLVPKESTRTNIQILLLRLALGGLFLHLGIEKINEGWVTSDKDLLDSLFNYHQRAGATQLVYLDKVAVPYAYLWAKLIAIGETAIGVSLILGLLTRFTCVVGIIMVLNFHAANGNLFSLTFFGTAWGALIVVSFIVLLIAKAGHWVGVDAVIAKKSPKKNNANKKPS